MIKGVLQQSGSGLKAYVAGIVLDLCKVTGLCIGWSLNSGDTPIP